jgi:uncharacterized membrane protein HdeD (DUF308 family)
MSTVFPYFLSAEREPLQELRRNWGWFVVLGILLIVVGMVAITYPYLVSKVAVEVFGFLLVAGAVLDVASGVWARRWSGFFLHLLGGLLYLFLGLVLIEHPGVGMLAITLLLAVLFVAGGLVRIVFALSHRFSGWGWAVLSGAISLILGIMIWRQLPTSAEWVIGLFVGIDFVFDGTSWVMLGLGLRSIPSGGTPAMTPTNPVV